MNGFQNSITSAENLAIQNNQVYNSHITSTYFTLFHLHFDTCLSKFDLVVPAYRYPTNSVCHRAASISFCSRMIVAANVRATEHKLYCRQTTVMPQLPALPMLCCLAFSPMVELRCDSTYTKYCGALCGLGYDKETKKSYYPENDVEIAFNFDLDDVTLTLINKVRHWLNVAINPTHEIGPFHVHTCRNRLQSYIKRLVEVSICWRTSGEL